MNVQTQQIYIGERALFKANYLHLQDAIFCDGESPLKESSNIQIESTIFKWKYPLWYSNHITMDHTTLLETARSGIWYTHDIQITNSTIAAPKTFRRASDITLTNVTIPNAEETLWNCTNIQLQNVSAKGDYFAMNASDLSIDHLQIHGNYCFDGVRNMHIKNSTLTSKDAFWNCSDVIVENCTIIGEYLGWNSKNLTFINCTIESLQGLCYIEQLKLVNCKLINTTLAFEYSDVDAQVSSTIESVLNPTSGYIEAKAINDIIFNDPSIQCKNTTIMTASIHSSRDCKDAAIC